jgi:putative selenium metabolism protein SsnA
MLLRDATLLHLDPPGLERGDLRIEGEVIVDKAPRLEARPGEPIHELHGGLVMPGLVLGHHHLYSSLARGMPTPPRTPGHFEEILELVWWRLDQALDLEGVYYSALVGGSEALLAGTTTLIDHHASPRAIAGSLSEVRHALEELGLRAILCYECTDRHGPAGFAEGLAENERFLRETSGTQFAGLVGAHAPFTLSDASLAACAELAGRFGCGVHIHVAESPCDEQRCVERFGAPLGDRLADHGILRPGTLLCHCTHLDDYTLARAAEAGCAFVHCPRSNMNNAVGYAPVVKFGESVLLGTDGISGDLFEEWRAAWWKSRDARTGLSPRHLLEWLNASARFASGRLGIPLGRLEAGAAADMVFLDYDPPTPLEADNLIGHILFGLSSRHVREVWVRGKPVVMEHRIVRMPPERLGEEARRVAREVWKRMAAIAPAIAYPDESR